VTKEQPTKHQETLKFTNSPNQLSRKWVDKEGTQAFYISNADHWVISFFLPFSFAFLFLSYNITFSFVVLENEIRISIIERHRATNCQIKIEYVYVYTTQTRGN